jgi:hypothetical protein
MAEAIVILWLLIVSLIVALAIIDNRSQADKGIGVRAIQFLAISIFIPAIVILSLFNKIDQSSTGTLLGVIAGYLLSNIAEFKNKNHQVRKTDKNG